MSDPPPPDSERQLDVIVVDEQDVAVPGAALGALAEAVLRAEGVDDGMLTVALVAPAAIRDLKARHLGIDETTDVLAFPFEVDPADQPPGMPVLLGDVIVCPAVAQDNVGAPGDDETWHAETFDDELALLVVHGVLHLLGHEHDEPEARAEMRAKEHVLLERFHRS